MAKAQPLIARDTREIFAPITKVYDGPDGFFVEGVLVAEEPDRVREIWDYESSKASVMAWASDFARKTQGASVGNLRAMHGSVAAGKFVSILPDDDNKRFVAKAEVVDDGEKEKVRKRVYTGFSIKAPYARKWADPENPLYTRWTQGPMIEASLVDLPCIYSATFSNHPMKFAVAVQGDDGQHIKEETRVSAALVSPTLVSLAKKGMYEVSQFACLLTELECLRNAIEVERLLEGDNSMVTDRICQYVGGLIDAFGVYTQEQIEELHGEHEDRHDARTAAGKGADSADGADDYYESFGVASKASEGEKPVGKTKYLVHDSEGNGHLPYTDSAGNVSHGRMGAAWAALHGGYRGRKYEGPNKAEAISKLENIYRREGMTTPGTKAADMSPEDRKKALDDAKKQFVDTVSKAFDSLMNVHFSTPSGDGIGEGSSHGGTKAANGDQGQGKVAGGDGTDAIKSAVEAAIESQLKPYFTAFEQLTEVVGKMASSPMPTGVARAGAATTAVDKKQDGVADNQRAASDNGAAAVKSAGELAKEGKIADAVKAVHAGGPSLVMTNRGIERAS